MVPLGRGAGRLIEPVFRPIGQDRRVDEDKANLDTGGLRVC
jgi:hypothetical protein